MFNDDAGLTTEPINERMLQHDSLLHFDGLDYFLCLPDEKSIKPSSQKDTVIALDPGIRTFMAGYSPNGTICKLGEGASTRLLRLLLKVDVRTWKVQDSSLI
jgi:putative transposase